MLHRVAIEGGPIVDLEGCPAQGTRHEVMFGVLADSGERVVVKIERIAGSLDRERAALEWLGTAAPGVAPQLLAFGNTTVNDEQVSCLVMERCAGSPPVAVEGWERMGCAVAGLAAVGRPTGLLPTLQPDELVDGHATRVTDLGARLDPFVKQIPDWAALRVRTLPTSTPLVLTHGDPGPGNYLDTGTTGTLVDWEDAQVLPIGLDLGRLMFIAMLGSGPAGYQAKDHQARRRAAARGYLRAVARLWRPSSEDIRWWLSVAAIQFIHRRWQTGGRPAPWEQAAQILPSAFGNEPTLSR